jgi:hypothetical protein
MQEDITCICGRRFEASYIEQHRKHCQINQQEAGKFKTYLDSFSFGNTIACSGVMLNDRQLNGS